MRLNLDKPFDEIFIWYEEEFDKEILKFEGQMKPELGTFYDHQIIKYISGGRKFKDFKLEKDNEHIKAWIKYFTLKEIQEGMEDAYDTELPNLKEDDVKKEKIEKPKNGSNLRRKKLPDEVVNQIRELHDNGYKQHEIGELFGISQQSVSQVVNFRKAYKKK